MKIKYTNWGIAYRYGNVIEINPILKHYPAVYKAILEHEKGHDVRKKMNFWHDLKFVFKFNKELLKFSIKHPILSLQSAMPVWYDKGWHHNPFMIIMWLVIILVVVGSRLL